MAPAIGPAFLPESLERIDIPVAIVAGAADAIALVGNNARSYAAHIPHAELTIFPGEVGHYVFTVDCTPAGRAAVHRRTWCRPRQNPCRDRAACPRVLCSAFAVGRGVMRTKPVVKTQRIARLADGAIPTRLDG